MKFRKYKLEDVCNIQIGKTPRREVREYWGKGYSWVSISDMKSRIITTTKEEITESAIKECGCKLIPEGTILMSFKLSIGKLAFAGKDLYTNEAIVGLEIKDKKVLHPDYLLYVLKNIPLIGSNNAAMGATLNKESLKILQLPVPSLSDQLHIANLLSKAENLISQRKQSIALLDEFLKSTFLEMFGDPLRNEKGWKTKTIEQLVKKEKYSLKRGPFGGALKKEIFVPSGYLVYEQYHALNNDFTFARYYIDEAKFQELKGFEVKPGDIIISCSGVYLGKLAIVPEGAKHGIINQALLKISLDNKIVESKFFVYVFSNENFKRKFYGNIIGTGIPNFPSMDDFKKFHFINPPIELQTQFAQIVEKTEALKAHYQSSLQELENLYGSLSQRAFRGELTLHQAAEPVLMAAEPEGKYK
jgi:type I restriction enzyme S subunit